MVGAHNTWSPEMPFKINPEINAEMSALQPHMDVRDSAAGVAGVVAELERELVRLDQLEVELVGGRLCGGVKP